MTDDLVRRLWEIIPRDEFDLPMECEGFTPEAVARALERMRTAQPCKDAISETQGYDGLEPSCNVCWASMLDTFLAALAAPDKEG